MEQRRFARSPIESPLSFSLKANGEKRSGVGKDIGLGGMFIETESPATFGAEVTVHLRLPGSTDMLALPAVVRWVRDGGMGVQFGLLGARETYLITEIGKNE